jgi:hypothetical protein
MNGGKEISRQYLMQQIKDFGKSCPTIFFPIPSNNCSPLYSARRNYQVL